MVGLYIAPPENAIVPCVDEKPSIQALERSQGDLKLPNGRTLTGHSHDYKHNGTSTLFAAFEVTTGKVKATHSKRRRRVHAQHGFGASVMLHGQAGGSPAHRRQGCFHGLRQVKLGDGGDNGGVGKVWRAACCPACRSAPVRRSRFDQDDHERLTGPSADGPFAGI